jgi:glycosyltransferase involved in cell wall biosynthesis
MNIGVLVAGLPPQAVGGAEVQAARLAKHLASAHRVTVFTRTPLLPEELRGVSGCEVVRRCRMTMPLARFGADVVSSLLVIHRRRRSLDVLVAFQTVIDGLIGALARGLSGLPLLVSVRSEKEYLINRSLQSLLLSPFVLRHSDRVAVQSPTLRAELLEALERAGQRSLRRRMAERLCVIPNGIEEAVSVADAGDVVLYVGRLVKDKGVGVLLEAMRACPGERLVVVGDGPDRKALQRTARSLANVSFLGPVAPNRIDELFQRAKILVLPSLRNEGLPNVLMEAMVRGIPVVAARNAGIPDLIEHGRTGLLAEPGDAAGIGRHICQISSQPGLRRQLAANARAEMSRYAWPVVVAALERELEAIRLRRRADAPPASS